MMAKPSLEEDTALDPVHEPAPEDSAYTDTAESIAPVGHPFCGEIPVGTDIDMCATDFSLHNKDNESIALYDFAGDIIFLDLSAFG